MPRWNTSGSPPEPSNEATSPITRSWSPAAHDIGHLAAEQREGVAHGEVAEAILQRVLVREFGAALRESSATSCWRRCRMLTAKRRLAVAFSSVREPCASETSTSNGSSDTDVNELSVIPAGWPWCIARDHAHAGGKAPTTSRNSPIDARHRRKHAGSRDPARRRVLHVSATSAPRTVGVRPAPLGSGPRCAGPFSIST